MSSLIQLFGCVNDIYAPQKSSEIHSGKEVHWVFGVGTQSPQRQLTRPLHYTCRESVSHVRLFKTLWTVACQALPFPWDFPGQEYWSGLPFTSPRDLYNARLEPGSPALQADSLPSEPPRICYLDTCRKRSKMALT